MWRILDPYNRPCHRPAPRGAGAECLCPQSSPSSCLGLSGGGEPWGRQGTPFPAGGMSGREPRPAPLSSFVSRGLRPLLFYHRMTTELCVPTWWRVVRVVQANVWVAFSTCPPGVDALLTLTVVDTQPPNHTALSKSGCHESLRHHLPGTSTSNRGDGLSPGTCPILAAETVCVSLGAGPSTQTSPRLRRARPLFASTLLYSQGN